jgi:hypothetical protein
MFRKQLFGLQLLLFEFLCGVLYFIISFSLKGPLFGGDLALTPVILLHLIGILWIFEISLAKSTLIVAALIALLGVFIVLPIGKHEIWPIKKGMSEWEVRLAYDINWDSSTERYFYYGVDGTYYSFSFKRNFLLNRVDNIHLNITNAIFGENKKELSDFLVKHGIPYESIKILADDIYNGEGEFFGVTISYIAGRRIVIYEK